jgi:all-trans-retinol dehydrogenase (NAD+)
MATWSDIPFVIIGILQTVALVLKSMVIFCIPSSLRYKEITGSDVVLITGAGSGLGRQFAIKFAELGCKKLILWDISEPGLQETKSLVESPKYGSKAWIYTVDVTQRNQVYEYAERVKRDLGSCFNVTYLINNAGVVAGNNILDLKDESIIRTFEVNAISHFWVSLIFFIGLQCFFYFIVQCSCKRGDELSKP